MVGCPQPSPASHESPAGHARMPSLHLSDAPPRLYNGRWPAPRHARIAPHHAEHVLALPRSEEVAHATRPNGLEVENAQLTRNKTSQQPENSGRRRKSSVPFKATALVSGVCPAASTKRAVAMPTLVQSEPPPLLFSAAPSPSRGPRDTRKKSRLRLRGRPAVSPGVPSGVPLTPLFDERGDRGECSDDGGGDRPQKSMKFLRHTAHTSVSPPHAHCFTTVRPHALALLVVNGPVHEVPEEQVGEGHTYDVAVIEAARCVRRASELNLRRHRRELRHSLAHTAASEAPEILCLRMCLAALFLCASQ